MLFGNSAGIICIRKEIITIFHPFRNEDIFVRIFWCSTVFLFKEVDAHFSTRKIFDFGVKIGYQKNIKKLALWRDIAFDTSFRCVQRDKGLREGKNGNVNGKTIGKWELLRISKSFKRLMPTISAMIGSVYFDVLAILVTLYGKVLWLIYKINIFSLHLILLTMNLLITLLDFFHFKFYSM